MIICGREDLGEAYLCEEIVPGRHGADPIVRVRACLRYPRQHALYWPDVAIEIPPVAAGTVCRLHYLRAATGAEEAADPAESLAAARRAALEAETNGEGREIIRRHMAGETRRRRAVVRYAEWQLEQLRRDI